MAKTYLIIGAGLSGLHGALQVRKHDDEGEIILFDTQDTIPFDLPPLSKEFLQGKVDEDKIRLISPEQLGKKRIDFRGGTTVDEINPDEHTIKIGDDTLAYDRLLLATGAWPIKLNIEGRDLKNIFYLRTLSHSKKLREAAQKSSSAVIVGAGFIGVETAASMKMLGVDKVTIIEMAKHLWPHFLDEKLASFFREYLEKKGVEFLFEETVDEFVGDEKISSVKTKSGKEIDCDLALVAIGVTPDLALAHHAGLKISDETKGIVVDEYLETSAKDIYAAGDIIDFYDPYAERRRRTEHWGHAQASGAAAGRNMAGAKQKFDHVSYVWSDIFDLHLEFAGDHSDYDEILLRGEMTPKGFTLLYLKDERLSAYFAVNTSPKEFNALKKIIASKRKITEDKEKLTDPNFDVKDLV